MEKMDTIATLWFDVPEKHEILRAQFIKEWLEVMKERLEKDPNEIEELVKTAGLATGLWCVLLAGYPYFYGTFKCTSSEKAEIWETALKQLNDYKNEPIGKWSFMNHALGKVQ